ncbi:MAG: hypothetical protein ABI277_09265 [Burkholderiaceae bacterium]
MNDAGEDEAFAFEAQRAGATDQRQVQQLDGDRSVEAAVGTARPPHAAGAAGAQRCLDHVGADPLAAEVGRCSGCAARVAVEEARRLDGGGRAQQRLDPAGEHRIARTQFCEPQRACALVALEQFIQQRAELFPVLCIR